MKRVLFSALLATLVGLPPLACGGNDGAATSSGSNDESLTPTNLPNTFLTPTPLVADPGHGGDGMPFKGSLIYKAKLDGTQSDIRSDIPGVCGEGSPPAGPPAQETALRFSPGAIDVSISKPGYYRNLIFNAVPKNQVVIEFDIAFQPGSTFAPSITLRSANPRSIYLQLNAVEQYLALALRDPQSPDARGFTTRELTPRVPISDLQTGRTILIGAAVDTDRYTVFLDGRKVIDVRSEQAGNGLATIGLYALGCNPGTGNVRVLAARVYDLAPGNESR